MAAEKTKTEPKVEEPKTVKIMIPKTTERQADVVVGINGYITKIQRGVEVEVSQAVYEVIQNSMKMDQLALERREAMKKSK